MPKDITIKIDTREQTPWDFHIEEKAYSGFKSRVTNIEVGTIDAADYTLVGFEDKIRIERKNGFGELFGNFTPKENKERFEREMEKLRNIPYKYILIETNLSKDALGLSPPQIYKGPPSSAVLRWLMQLQMEYSINVMFVGDAGKRVARTIFEEFIKKHG